MTKLVAGKISTQEKEYTGCRECKKKECSCGKHDMGLIKFTTYSTNANDRWYSIKGWGAKNVKEGDTIEGEVSSKEYNGKTYYTITLPKPDPMAEIKEFKETLEKVDARLFALEQAVFNQLPLSNDEPPLADEDEPYEDEPF